MTTVLQVEYRSALLSIREEILNSIGHPVLSVLGSRGVRKLNRSLTEVGVIVIGHGASWQERYDLVAYFKEALPRVPVVALLRRRDEPFDRADFNCPADNPPLWVRTVTQALRGFA